jgi:hypothetical protein
MDQSIVQNGLQHRPKWIAASSKMDCSIVQNGLQHRPKWIAALRAPECNRLDSAITAVATAVFVDVAK